MELSQHRLTKSIQTLRDTVDETCDDNTGSLSGIDLSDSITLCGPFNILRMNLVKKVSKSLSFPERAVII